MRLLIFFYFLLLGVGAHAQNVEGLWTGRFTSLSPLNSISYKYELLIFQNGRELSGYSYSTADNGIFYLVSEITGKLFDDYMVITETKTVYVNFKGGEEISQTHILFFNETGNILEATGDWKEAKPKKRMYPEEGKTFLRKTEDHNRSRLIKILNEKNAIAVQPEKEEEKPVARPIAKEPTVMNTDSAKLASRAQEVLQMITLQSDSVILELYDDGIVDGDSVTVFVNNNVLVGKQQLGMKPIKFSIFLTDENSEVLISMYADNLGTIPPNTGLLVIKDGEKKYEVRFSSDSRKTAAVKLVGKQK